MGIATAALPFVFGNLDNELGNIFRMGKQEICPMNLDRAGLTGELELIFNDYDIGVLHR